MKRGLAGFVLGAGSGTRLRPLTDELPKALCPVGNVPLVDIALARVSAQVLDVAVNAHSTAPALVQHLDGANVRVSVEYGDRLGTAGAIGNMRRWLDGRDVLIHNADAYVTDDLSTLLEGWTGERPRLLVKTGRSKSDFGCRRFCGVSLLPGPIAAQLKPQPSGLYELVWRGAHLRQEVEFVEVKGVFIDCGTPHDYHAANMHRSRRSNVVGPGASVLGTIERCVVWEGARVESGETLRDSIRTRLRTVSGLPTRPRPGDA